MGKTVKLKWLNLKTDNNFTKGIDDNTLIYPQTLIEAVLATSEDKDEANPSAPQGSGINLQTIINSIRKNGWVTGNRIQSGAVTKDKLGADVLKQLNDEAQAITTDKIVELAKQYLD